MEPVLFLDNSASPAALFDAAERRVDAVRDLLEALSDCRTEDHQPNALAQVARAAALLLADAEDLQMAARQKLVRQERVA
ncbi:hypothetical protein D3C78_1632860 [compost metagenome]